MPATSPIAQPVRQCRVACAAVAQVALAQVGWWWLWSMSASS
jgi:hypothetical protein